MNLVLWRGHSCLPGRDFRFADRCPTSRPSSLRVEQTPARPARIRKPEVPAQQTKSLRHDCFGTFYDPVVQERKSRMSMKAVVLAACASLFPIMPPARAHHAFAAEFDIKAPVKLRGTVQKMEWVNPHSWIYIDVKGDDGTIVTWMVEGGSPNALLRLGFNKTALAAWK